MKFNKMLALIAFMMMFYYANSQQDSVLYGNKRAIFNVRISPDINWSITPDKGYVSTVNGGVKLTFTTDFRISNSCFVSTGLQYSYSKIGILSSTYEERAGNKTSYLGIPLSLKIKSSPERRSRFYGEAGFDFGVLIASDYWISNAERWGSYLDNNSTLYNNELSRVKFGGLIGLGYEYYLNANLGLQFGVLYHAGFTNIIKENQSGANVVKPQSFDFVIGLLF